MKGTSKAALRATAELRATAALRTTAAFRTGRAKRALRFFILPAVVVIGLITVIVTLTPGPATARAGGVSNVSAVSAAGAGKIEQASALNAGSRQVASLKARTADLAAARAVAQAEKEAATARADHAFHIEHLAHLRFLAARAAAARAAAASAAWAKSHPAPLVTHASVTPITSTAPVSSGVYSESMLERLWVAEGGSAGEEGVAACIAEHESGGNPGAVSPTDDYGLWQINAVNASPSLMLNPEANAREAISLSRDGTNWSPWTTAPDCAGASVTAAVSPSGGIVGFALSFKGYPYVYGGTSPAGFDCSGFAQYVYARFGKSIPRTSEEQAAYLARVSSPSPGDLVFYWSGSDAFHVAIYIGGGQVISALNQNAGVVVTPLSWPGPDYSFGTLA